MEFCIQVNSSNLEHAYENVGNSLGLCPDWDSWDQTKPVDNAREAMQQADEWLGVPQVTSLFIV